MHKVAALGLVVAHDLIALELVLTQLRIPAVQNEEAARQPFVAFVARPRYARGARIGGILAVAVGRSFGMPVADEDFEALVRGCRLRLVGWLVGWLGLGVLGMSCARQFNWCLALFCSLFFSVEE